MKPDLVSPVFLFTFGCTFGKHTGNISISSKIQRIFQVIFDSSNHQRGIRVSYDTISFNLLWGFFRPRYAIVIVKRDECRNCVNIGYS